LAQVILDVIDYGKNIYDAIVSPRLHHQLMPNSAIVEDDYPQSHVSELRSRGHDVSLTFSLLECAMTMFIDTYDQVVVLPKYMKITAVQGVMRSPEGKVYGASDVRKFGQAAVY
jgi:gamma-glutamyltranspeptidase/glutathione hydrolase/leukotriene-C4 hydrolase